MKRRAPLQAIDPRHPQPRHIGRAAELLAKGGLLAFPSDSAYALGCDLRQKKAVERMAELRRRDPRKPFSFQCADLAQVSTYAVVANEPFRILRRLTPGPYTFVLPATREVPRVALTRQRTVGVRLPDAPVGQALVHALGAPMAITTAAQPDGPALLDAETVQEELGHGLDLILDGGPVADEPSTILDLTGPTPVVLREGKGSLEGIR